MCIKWVLHWSTFACIKDFFKVFFVCKFKYKLQTNIFCHESTDKKSRKSNKAQFKKESTYQTYCKFPPMISLQTMPHIVCLHCTVYCFGNKGLNIMERILMKCPGGHNSNFLSTLSSLNNPCETSYHIHKWI